MRRHETKRIFFPAPVLQHLTRRFQKVRLHIRQSITKSTFYQYFSQIYILLLPELNVVDFGTNRMHHVTELMKERLDFVVRQ